MTDTVNRQAVIDIIHNTIFGFFDVCGDDEEVPMSDKDKLLLEVNKAICNKVEELEQEPGWIPVSEELPKIDTYVLCTVAFKYDKPTIIISKYDAEDYWFNGIVTAWMPLPKLYEPKEYKEKEKWER